MKIKNLQHNSGEWAWTETTDDSSTEYKTNLLGHGLWVLAPGNTCAIDPDTGKYRSIYEWKQILGTCQFSLNGYSMSGARKKIARRHPVYKG